jgi:cobalt-precorrin-5B (C1)-methyltransferase
VAKGAGKRLRSGFTTGTAATAAVKGALIHLLSGQIPRQVKVQLLNGTSLPIIIETCQPVDGNTTRCTVIKDAGDDPDITHRAQIGAQVRIRRNPGATRIRITGGPGVGTVTKPGLETPPGQPAITSGPLKMIHLAVEEVLDGFGCRVDAAIEIFVPQGELLARKTLNARLGIVGGISILGTTGVVKPLSHAAYIATIAAGLSVAKAAGARQVVLTTGRRSERFARGRWPAMAEEAFIQMGDCFAKTMEMTAGCGFEQVIIAAFFGKAVKMAQGIAHTHARSARLTLDRLAQWALDVTGSADLARQVAEANTARQVFDFIKDDHPELIERVGREIVQVARKFSEDRVALRAVIFDFDGGSCFDSQMERCGF